MAEADYVQLPPEADYVQRLRYTLSEATPRDATRIVRHDDVKKLLAERDALRAIAELASEYERLMDEDELSGEVFVVWQIALDNNEAAMKRALVAAGFPIEAPRG